MKRYTIGILVFCLLPSLSSNARPALRQAMEQHILSQRIKLHLKKDTLMYALSTLSVEHRVPIGIEYSRDDRNEPKLNLERDHATLKEVLDSIVKQEPLYRWEIADGVINLVPTKDRDPFIEALLNTRVAHFAPGKWSTIFQVRDAIGDIPEVKRLLESNQKTIFKYGDYAYSPSIYTKKNVDLSISDTNVRGVLNRMIRDSEHKEWSIGWRPGEKDVLSIRF
jgi:hypothetical protein